MLSPAKQVGKDLQIDRWVFPKSAETGVKHLIHRHYTFATKLNLYNEYLFDILMRNIISNCSKTIQNLYKCQNSVKISKQSKAGSVLWSFE